MNVYGREFTIEETRKFLYNKDNIQNCSECPYNDGFDSWQDRYPCGQWHCWVAVHCREEE